MCIGSWRRGKLGAHEEIAVLDCHPWMRCLLAHSSAHSSARAACACKTRMRANSPRVSDKEENLRVGLVEAAYELLLARTLDLQAQTWLLPWLDWPALDDFGSTQAQSVLQSCSRDYCDGPLIDVAFSAILDAGNNCKNSTHCLHKGSLAVYQQHGQ